MNDDELKILRRKKQNADKARAYRQRKKDRLDAMLSASTVQSGESSDTGSENIVSSKLLHEKKLNAERCRRYRQKCKRLKPDAKFLLDILKTSNGQYHDDQSSESPIKLDIISDGADLSGIIDAYDKFALLMAKKIKSIHSIGARIRLMNAIQDLVDNVCAKNEHDPIHSSMQQTLAVPVSDGTIMIENAVLQPKVADPEEVKQPDVPSSVHVQQITIDPTPSTSQQNTKKAPAKRRKVTKLAEENPPGETYVEVPVEAPFPTEFVSLDLKPNPGPSSEVGEPRPHIDILEIKEEKIEEEETSPMMPTENEMAVASISGITFVNDPIPIKLEVTEMEEFEKY